MRAALIRVARSIRTTRMGIILRGIYHSAPIYWLLSRFFKLDFSFTSVVGLKPSRPSDRGAAPAIDEEQLRPPYEASPVAKKADTFVIYRIIGNDLIPRHSKGQSRENLRFILDQEPDLPGCEKRFVVNRIVDKAEESAIIELLESCDRPYLHIPFSMAEYAEQTWDLKGLPEPGYTLTQRFDKLPDDFRSRFAKRLYRQKNNYVINNNGARNAALEDGKERAKWVLPWDGNCFLTAEAWEEIAASITAAPWYPYVIIPMARVSDRAKLAEPGYKPAADQEPQIIFRSDSKEIFDREYYYGRRPKVELLLRLGVPGPWDTWALEPWDLPYPEYCKGAGAWLEAGWVARLPSGRPNLEQGAGSETRRLDARTEAVTGFLSRLDATLLSEKLPGYGVPRFLEGVSPHRYDELTAEAPARLSRVWPELEPVLLHKSRRETSRATRGAESLLLSHTDLPFLLDCAPKGLYRREMEQLFDWLQTDAGARTVRRQLAPAGTWHNLLTALLAAKLNRFDDLSRELLYAADRASVTFGGNGKAGAVCREETHRLAWQALDTLASRWGMDLWLCCDRPSELDKAIDNIVSSSNS